MNSVQIHVGDCLDALREMPDGSIDSIVTDPPYGLSFMGKRWDYDVPSVEIWAECLRVLKPGGHLLAFAGTRTQHRMAVRIEDAGFEIRDMIAWVYGSGFPKSLDVSKAIDKKGGVDTAAFKASLRSAVERSGMSRKEIDEACGFTMRFDTPYESDPVGWGVSLPSPEKWAKIASVLGMRAGEWAELVDSVWRGRAGAEISANGSMAGGNFERTEKGAPATDAARQWQGWGTALKPAMEPITVARKPLEGTVAANVLEHGTGALNIDGCRVDATGDAQLAEKYASVQNAGRRENNVYGSDSRDRAGAAPHQAGRFPANLIHDGSKEVAGLFPQTGKSTGGGKKNGDKFGGGYAPPDEDAIGYGDTGSAARFFYCTKASKRDRDEGLDHLPEKQSSVGDNRPGGDFSERLGKTPGVRRNIHPTVKPTDLMRYLCRLVTPPGGVVLDPFMGSGSTGKAAMLEGFRFIGCELSPEYAEIAKRRIAATQAQPGRPKQETTDLFAA